MTLYICMTIAGTIPVLICFVLWLIQKKSYNFRLGKILLLIGMGFYLVPFQLVKNVLPKWTAPILTLSTDINIKQDLYKITEIKSILSSGDSVWMSTWLIVFLIAWLCCVIVFAVYQVVKYRIDIHRLLAQSQKVSVDIDGKSIELLVNKNIYTPYTVGFIKQSIIVPDGGIEHNCFSMFYRHEEEHRRNHDSLMKLICIIIICIHWINPFAILILFLYKVSAEYLCDAKALEGCSVEEKKRYAELLIKLSSKDEPLSMIWRNNLSTTENLMKRRILHMMRKDNAGKVRKGIAVAVSVLTVLASTSTIFAYEPLMSTDVDAIGAFEDGDFGAFSINDEVLDCDFSTSDRVFIYEDGTQEDVTDEPCEYALCNHILVNGYYSVHKPQSSGGCIVDTYYAQKCTRCGYVDIGDHYATHIYDVCPH